MHQQLAHSAANPTVMEVVGDAWQELSGYDGRIAATVRGLIEPGRLTVDYINGRRARYLSPVKLYITVSVIYFLIAAAAPKISTRTDGAVTGPAGLRIEGVDDQDLTAEERADLQQQIARVFFGMLPVFAAVVALFYRGRRFPAALVFSVHLHAFAFVVLAVPELAKFTYSRPIAIVATVSGMLTLAVYFLRSLRAVFGGGWVATIVKAAAIGIVYLIASIPAFTIILIWASLT